MQTGWLQCEHCSHVFALLCFRLTAVKREMECASIKLSADACKCISQTTVSRTTFVEWSGL